MKFHGGVVIDWYMRSGTQWPIKVHLRRRPGAWGVAARWRRPFSRDPRTLNEQLSNADFQDLLRSLLGLSADVSLPVFKDLGVRW